MKVMCDRERSVANIILFSIQIKAIQSMSKGNRADLLRILQTIEDTLKKNWQGYEGFEDLQEKISRLRTILEEADNLKNPPAGTSPILHPNITLSTNDLHDSKTRCK